MPTPTSPRPPLDIIEDIPSEILQAARTIEDFFTMRGCKNWKLGGIQNRPLEPTTPIALLCIRGECKRIIQSGALIYRVNQFYNAVGDLLIWLQNPDTLESVEGLSVRVIGEQRTKCFSWAEIINAY
jgi:hypothetical protein